MAVEGLDYTLNPTPWCLVGNGGMDPTPIIVPIIHSPIPYYEPDSLNPKGFKLDHDPKAEARNPRLFESPTTGGPTPEVRGTSNSDHQSPPHPKPRKPPETSYSLNP